VTAAEFGRDLANEWEEQVSTLTDSAHDLAAAVRVGNLAEGDLSQMREAFVERMRQIMEEIITDACLELAEG